MGLLMAMFGVGPQEMLILLIIVLVLFGSSRLPGLMRSLGRSVTEFKKGISGDSDEEEEEELERPMRKKPAGEIEENSNGNEKSLKEHQAEAK